MDMETIPIAFIILQGIFAWFATGFDDAINFASILSQAKTNIQKIQVYIGMMASFLVMLLISIFFGEAITRFSEGYFMGISIRFILVCIAASIVFIMGVRAYRDATSETSDEVQENPDDTACDLEKKHTMEATVLHWILPTFATKIFLLYQVNSSDDIITNTSFFLALSGDQIVWFALGLTIGVASMMGIIHRFSETLEKYPKYAAILMILSSCIILLFGIF
jgi:cadmium resistance protein CadD (predicted permease)